MSDINKMKIVMEEILIYSISPLDLAQSYSWKIKYFNNKRQSEDAISTAIQILDILEERIVDNRCASMTMTELLQLRNYIDKTSEAKILIKQMKNDDVLAFMMILNDTIISCISNLQLTTSILA